MDMYFDKNTDFRRGEIYYINKGTNSNVGSEQYPDRPGVIVSNDKNNEYSGTVEVIYLTTQPKNDLPTHCTIRSTGRVSTALCEQIHTVSTERIGKYIAKCTDNEMMNIEIGMMISVGIEGGVKRDQKKSQDTDEESVRKATEKTAYERQQDKRLEELIQLRTERDIFKKLYEQMTEKLIGGKTNE